MTSSTRIMWNGTVRALPFKEQLKAASAARCSAISVTPSDYIKWLGSSVSNREMLAMANDSGVTISHLDPFVSWVDEWKPDLPEETFPLDSIAFEEDDFFRMAAALQVRSFTAWGAFPVDRYSVSELTDAFGKLCRRAEREGLQCRLEFIPVFGIRDLATAWRIVDGAGAANASIVLDLWHYMRGGRDDELLARIPGERIGTVQLCDATLDLPPGVSLAFDGLNNRRAPGEGEFPIAEILAVLRRTGGLREIGVEVFSPEFDHLSADEIGRRCRTALDAAEAQQ